MSVAKLKSIVSRIAKAHQNFRRYRRGRRDPVSVGPTWHLLPLPTLKQEWFVSPSTEDENRLHEVMTGDVGPELKGRLHLNAEETIQENCGNFAESFTSTAPRSVLLAFDDTRYSASLVEYLDKQMSSTVSISYDKSENSKFSLSIRANCHMFVRPGVRTERACQPLVDWWSSIAQFLLEEPVTVSVTGYDVSKSYRIEFERHLGDDCFANGSRLGARYETLDECLDVVERIFSDGVERPTYAECSVLTDEAIYECIREKIEPFDLPWITSYEIGYSKDAPDFWKRPDGFRDARFPLGQWYELYEAIVLQVDVVHSEDGSFLEFQSVCDREDFLKLLEPAADLIGDLECWDGLPQHRWDR